MEETEPDADSIERFAATRTPRDGESVDARGHIRPVPAGVGPARQELGGDPWEAARAAADRAEEVEDR